MRTVLLFQSSFCESNRLEYDAVFRFAREHRWQVKAIPYAKAGENRYRIENAEEAPDVRGLIAYWKADGCIVDNGCYPSAMPVAEFARTPVVFLGVEPKTVRRNVMSVVCDSKAVADAAADELIRPDLCEYAFVEWPWSMPWNGKRRERFAERVALAGGHLTVVQSPKCDDRRSDGRNRLARFVKELPRPCGVFAVNDLMAEMFISVAMRLGFSVPDDFTVVGVDDDHAICENAPVTISSVAQEFGLAATLAAENLEAMMNGERRGGVVQYGVARMVRRASSLCLRRTDVSVRRAMEFIRSRAFGRLSVDDVVKEMGCSRRIADMRFAASTGSTILREIQTARIAAACQLLEDPQRNVNSVAESCGFASAIDFHRVFKRILGTTPLTWRRARRGVTGK